MVIRIMCLIIGYIFGLFQTGYIIGKIHHMDVRDYGSGNAGTTNTMRVLGKKAGIITFLGDGFKAIIAIALVRIFIGRAIYPDIEMVLALYTGLGVVLGHNFPFYMGFKGGKGIAATAGTIAGVGNPVLIILAIVTFAGTALISKYVSLASLVTVTAFTVEMIIFCRFNIIKGISQNSCIEIYILLIIFTVLAFIRHKQNIIRLANHTERKIGEKKENL